MAKTGCSGARNAPSGRHMRATGRCAGHTCARRARRGAGRLGGACRRPAVRWGDCASRRDAEQRTFLLFLMVTRVTPGTGFIPSFIIALRLFFSLRLCLEPASPPPVRTARQPGRQAARDCGRRRRAVATARRCAGARRSAASSARRGRRTLSGVRQIGHVVVIAAVFLVVVLDLFNLGLRRRGAGAKRQRRRSLRRWKAGKCSPKAMPRRFGSLAARLAAPRA